MQHIPCPRGVESSGRQRKELKKHQIRNISLGKNIEFMVKKEKKRWGKKEKIEG